MGLGPIQAIYQARFLHYLQDRGHAKTAERKVWAFMGDGEMDEPESLGAIGMASRENLDNLVLRHQLQPAAPRRPGARQRQDHPGARGRFPRRGLNVIQGDLGLLLGSAHRARQGRLPAEAHGGRGGRRVPEVQEPRRRLRARAFLRQVSGDACDGRQHVRRGRMAPESRRPRSAQGVRGLRLGGEAQGASRR